jgi:hypothetical protein
MNYFRHRFWFGLICCAVVLFCVVFVVYVTVVFGLRFVGKYGSFVNSCKVVC